MPRLSDNFVLEPKPVTDPLLAIALGLDRSHPGYLEIDGRLQVIFPRLRGHRVSSLSSQLVRV
jgi:hypothetical protein